MGKLMEIKMLLDLRTYTCKPGTIKKHLEIYEEFGKAAQSRHLGHPIAYLVTETGNVNQYVHIWAYESAGDREAKRTAMQADPDWIKYTQESAKLGALVNQENKLMKPVDFYAAPKR
jgi:hypothetical protein